jgi:hypothetical protein
MAKATTTLTAQDQVILFCTATGISHVAVGITVHAMQSLAVRGFIVHDRQRGHIRPRIAAALRSFRPLEMRG